MPKLREPPADAVDPIADLWRVGPNGPKGPKGPSVFKLNQGRAIDILRADYPRCSPKSRTCPSSLPSWSCTTHRASG